MSEADTVRTSMFREALQMVVRMYKQHIWPLPFERVFYIDCVRIKVEIAEYKPQPVRDEDDNRAD